MKQFWNSYDYLHEEDEQENTKKPLLPKILSSIIVMLIAAIVFGTAVAFQSEKAKMGANLRKADPTPQEMENTNSSTYADIGELRASTKNRDSLIIIQPWFPYPSDDSAFYEELSQKNREIKSIILSYFSSYTKQELMNKGENTVKKEILEAINKQLIMGNLESVYFSEYLFLN